MNFDEVLKQYLGGTGLYQVLLLLFTASAGINITFNSLDFIFTGAVPDFRCDVGNISHLEANLTEEQVLAMTSPWDEDTEKYDSCLMYDRNYSELTVDDVMKELVNATAEKVTCTQFVFSKEQFSSTVTSQWGLVCDREWLLATTQAVYMSGSLTALLGGWIMDRFGRKPMALSMMCLHVAARAIIPFSVNYTMFICCRFLQSIATTLWYSAIFFINVEMVGEKWRVLAGQAIYFFWSIGYVILAGMAYFFRDWADLALILLVFTAPYLLHVWFLPESTRWLLSKNRMKEATSSMKTIKKINRSKMPPTDVLLEEVLSEDKKPRMLDLVKSRQQVKLLLILAFEWLSIAFLYGGLIYYIPVLGGNIYVSTAVSGALEIPSLLYVQVSLNTRLGRRLNTTLTFIVGGVSLIILPFLPKDLTWLTMVLALIGRFANTATFSIVYIHSAELFPTPVRSLGLMICSSFARIGSVVAPYITLARKVSPLLAPMFMGTLAVIAGFVVLLLPETYGKYLPEKFVAMEQKPSESSRSESDQSGDENDNEMALVSKTM